eukprot:TRINITY_DN18434_c0_g1_i1.p1 TRINITY_DN18434_c0_g1~~TRINITY_DN18434_c0_g1_i1.p1  ORF type:complete len:418 (+),score=97.64 TRINITY_DN18434_c0_g1_i1:61-1254(+)
MAAAVAALLCAVCGIPAPADEAAGLQEAAAAAADPAAALRALGSHPGLWSHFWGSRPLLLRGLRTPRVGVADVLAAIENGTLQGRVGHLVHPDVGSGAQRTLKTMAGWRWTAERLERFLTAPPATLVVNDACAVWPLLAEWCRAFMQVAGHPVNGNLYITPAALNVGLPAHNDVQDVFVLQLDGVKRWEVYGHDERSRGKLRRREPDDVVDVSSLGEPLVRHRMRRGDLLYVPRGFIHRTSCRKKGKSPAASESDSAPGSPPWHQASVSLTLGLDHAGHGLTRAAVLRCAADLAGSAPPAPTVADPGDLVAPGWGAALRSDAAAAGIPPAAAAEAVSRFTAAQQRAVAKFGELMQGRGEADALALAEVRMVANDAACPPPDGADPVAVNAAASGVEL